MIAGDQRPHQCGKTMVTMQVRRYRNAPTSVASMSKWSSAAMLHALEKTFLGTTRATGCTCKFSAMLPSGDQLVAAIANDESLEVSERAPLQLSTLWHSKVPKKKRGVFWIHEVLHHCKR